MVDLEALLEAAQDRDRVLDVGASTITGWKRRSSAASFSMCLRYSSSVVAPMQCSSPRASIGLSMLPASGQPSVLPAPTMVCSSSMKSRIRPSLLLDLVEHRLQALLELAAVLGAGEQRAHVEREEVALLQPLGHVARARCAGRGLRRSPSCRRPARRSAPGCSWSCATGCGSPGGSRRRGRSPDRACRRAPASRGRRRTSRAPRRWPPGRRRSRAGCRARR